MFRVSPLSLCPCVGTLYSAVFSLNLEDNLYERIRCVRVACAALGYLTAGHMATCNSM